MAAYGRLHLILGLREKDSTQPRTIAVPTWGQSYLVEDYRGPAVWKGVCVSDDLALIKRVKDEYQVIMGHVKLVGDSISDHEALKSLREAHADWIPGRPEILAEKQKRLQRTLSFLDEGLQSHFAHEEKFLPPLLGELFMRALILDHREIAKEIDRAKSIVADMELEGLDREGLLSRDSYIQRAIESIIHLIDDHATREEIVLDMLERALQDK